MEQWSVIGRLRRAVNKVRFLLNFNLQKWLSSAALLGGSFSSNRQLSFGDCSTEGLSLCTDQEHAAAVSRSHSDVSRGSSSSLQRMISRGLSSDLEFDIDNRAGMFISNFYRQLQIERQISLELQYQNKFSFGSSKSSP